MIIQTSAMAMESKRIYRTSYTSKETLTTWGESEKSSISTSGKGRSKVQAEKPAQDVESAIKKIRRSICDYLYQIIFGEDVSKREIFGLDDAWTDLRSTRQGFGGEYTTEEYYSETEFTTFQTTGMVQTADGRTIEFNVNVNMSRTLMQYSRQTISFGERLQVTDPLVINLDINIATVSDQTFYFDLDVDGKKEKINGLASGSGFLALDKNEDGIINDGSELFGAQSGDGFADLSTYDEDGNGWIDEGDGIFSKLKVWYVDGNGTNRQITLKDAGVGAICLMNQNTLFTLHGRSGLGSTPSAYIRKTGIFLYENGMAGTVQHLDMVAN